jgi:hypothetical protein
VNFSKQTLLPAELSYCTNCHLHCFVTTAKKMDQMV